MCSCHLEDAYAVLILWHTLDSRFPTSSSWQSISMLYRLTFSLYISSLLDRFLSSIVSHTFSHRREKKGAMDKVPEKGAFPSTFTSELGPERPKEDLTSLFPTN